MSVINFKSKVIFIHIPRTSGSSIEEHSFVGGVGHKSITNIRPWWLHKKFMKPYFKFAFVRNPWDRFVSLFFYFKQMDLSHQWYKEKSNKAVIKELSNIEDFDTFCKKFHQLKCRYDIHFQEQYTFIANKKGEILVDFVGQFEKLQYDWDFVCKKIGVKTPTLDVKNKADHKPYQEYYTEETKEIVRKTYAKDIIFFGYDF